MVNFHKSAIQNFRKKIRVPELKFISVFLVSLAGLGLVIFILAVVVDPYNIFGFNIFKPILLTNRNEKLRLLAEANPKPEIIILGSSRVFKMEPRKIEELAGQKTFNASVSFARPEEHLAMAKYIVQDLRITPKVFLVGVNVAEFNNDEIDSQTINNSHLRKYLPIDRGDLIITLFKSFKERFNINYLRDVFIAIFWNSYKFPNPTITFDKNGGEIFDKNILTERNSSELNLQISLALLRNQTALNKTRKNYFEDFLNFAQSKDIKVIVFLLPFSEKAQNLLREKTAYAALREEFLNDAKEWQKKYSISFFDFSNLETWRGLGDDFDDSTHTGWRNLELIARKIFKAAPL